MKERLLLTGGGGMVGRNLLENEDFIRHDIIAPPRSELDLLDGEAVRRVIGEFRPSLIVHAAGKVGGISANEANQAAFLYENLLMGVNLARAAADGGVPRFLNLSSSCVYPRDAKNPLMEDCLLSGRLEPTNEGYALAKLAILRLGEFLAKQSNGFSWVSLIPCNLYGRWDHFEPDRSHLVPAIIHKIHGSKELGNEVVDIWGDGTARREFMLASDLAEFVARAVAHFDRLPTRINVGVGRDYTVNEYYQAVAGVVAYEGGFEHDLSRPVGMPQKLVDTTQQEILGWMPSTSLRDGMESTYRFYQEHVL